MLLQGLNPKHLNKKPSLPTPKKWKTAQPLTLITVKQQREQRQYIRHGTVSNKIISGLKKV